MKDGNLNVVLSTLKSQRRSSKLLCYKAYNTSAMYIIGSIKHAVLFEREGAG
jgi:hypothetical protein